MSIQLEFPPELTVDIIAYRPQVMCVHSTLSPVNCRICARTAQWPWCTAEFVRAQHTIYNVLQDMSKNSTVSMAYCRMCTCTEHCPWRTYSKDMSTHSTVHYPQWNAEYVWAINYPICTAGYMRAQYNSLCVLQDMCVAQYITVSLMYCRIYEWTVHFLRCTAGYVRAQYTIHSVLQGMCV
jgi:hypothetical protein